MTKTKTTFLIFIFLLVLVFPYYILYLRSDFSSSIVPGWHSTIYPLATLLKFIILLIVTYYYWKLSKVVNEIHLNKLIIYFSLTVPGVLITKLDLFDLLNFSSDNRENLMMKIKIIVFIKTFTNILFFTGQFLFCIYYKNQIKKINLNSHNSTKVQP